MVVFSAQNTLCHSKSGRQSESDLHYSSFWRQAKSELLSVFDWQISSQCNSKGNGDWDVERALHKSFKNLLRELEHKLREGPSYEKAYE